MPRIKHKLPQKDDYFILDNFTNKVARHIAKKEIGK